MSIASSLLIFRIGWQFRAVESILYRFRAKLNSHLFDKNEWCKLNLSVMNELEQLIGAYKSCVDRDVSICQSYEKFMLNWLELFYRFLQAAPEWCEEHAHFLSRRAQGASNFARAFERIFFTKT